MKNKDIIAMEKAKVVEAMNKAIAENDADAFQAAFEEYCQKVEESIVEMANQAIGAQDASVLTARGVRQLTSKEKAYYEAIIDAMKSSDPRQALSNVEVTMPETIIDSVFDELKTEHPLLSKINATSVTGLTKMMMNTNGEQKAAWGKLTAAIVEELTSGFKEVDVTQDKLSAFLPVSKAMLDLGPAWLDRYVREVLQEAIANGLEDGIINGTGKDQPIGMIRQVGEGAVVISGVYPEKKAIKVTAMDMEQLGNIVSIMAKNDKGQSRTVDGLIMLVNPTDYYKRVLPATRMLTPEGVYASVLPLDIEIMQSAQVKEGKVILGMGQKYFLGAGMSKDGKIEYSDEYHFLEDERVYLVKLYANGFATDNNAFQVLDISDLNPVKFKVVNVTETVEEDATLAALSLGSAALSPAFSANTTTYTATTSNAKNTIVATPTNASADVEITVGETSVTNGSAITWAEGSNTVTIKVEDGETTKTYTVTVTKE